MGAPACVRWSPVLGGFLHGDLLSRRGVSSMGAPLCAGLLCGRVSRKGRVPLCAGEGAGRSGGAALPCAGRGGDNDTGPSPGRRAPSRRISLARCARRAHTHPIPRHFRRRGESGGRRKKTRAAAAAAAPPLPGREQVLPPPSTGAWAGPGCFPGGGVGRSRSLGAMSGETRLGKGCGPAWGGGVRWAVAPPPPRSAGRDEPVRNETWPAPGPQGGGRVGLPGRGPWASPRRVPAAAASPGDTSHQITELTAGGG